MRAQAEVRRALRTDTPKGIRRPCGGSGCGWSRRATSAPICPDVQVASGSRTTVESAMGTELKLRIDLIPETCWGKNLRLRMKRSEWDKLRKKVYADQGHACSVCGARGRLHCHES